MINLSTYIQELYTDNYNTLVRDIKGNPNKLRETIFMNQKTQHY